jgi:hypothetical protein
LAQKARIVDTAFVAAIGCEDFEIAGRSVQV